MTPLETVNTFMKAAAARDYDRALRLLSEDIEYQNMPLPPVHGHQAVKDTLEMILGTVSTSEWVVHHQLASEDLVMNERTDRFKVQDSWVELPVVGVFELSDGVIVRWRDYFDLPTFTNQFTPPGTSDGM